jgi:hypothetical protein
MTASQPTPTAIDPLLVEDVALLHVMVERIRNGDTRVPGDRPLSWSDVRTLGWMVAVHMDVAGEWLRADPWRPNQADVRARAWWDEEERLAHEAHVAKGWTY